MPIPRDHTCGYPGCDQGIERINRSKVCRMHLHVWPYCQCQRCGGDEPAPESEARADVREVMVPAFTSHSAVIGYARVTVPRAPWEVG